MKPAELIEQGRFLGEEFVLWLWHRGLAEGGTSGMDGDTSACFLDDSIVLVTERGDVKRLGLDKGNPAESREAFEALSRGMRPSKAKVRVLSGDMEWVFTLNASDLQVSGCKLPPTQSKDLAGRLQDRLFLVEELQAHLDRRFAQFLAERVELNGSRMQNILTHWIMGSMGQGFDKAEKSPWGDGPDGEEMTMTVSVNGKEIAGPVPISRMREVIEPAARALVESGLQRQAVGAP